MPAEPLDTPRRYVLLRHECPADYRDGPHWDLMLEEGDALRTWSLLELPAVWLGALGTLPNGRGSVRAATVRERSNTVTATELPPHRLAYLEREGEISGGRGTVARVARGEFQLVEETHERVIVEALTGELCGVWRLERVGDAWKLTVVE